MQNYNVVIAALAVAFILTILFSVLLKNKGPWGGLWVVFIIIFRFMGRAFMDQPDWSAGGKCIGGAYCNCGNYYRSDIGCGKPSCCPQ